ncbi:MAG: ABC transporter ATP-binding protein [Acidobacteria bacterium]|nr:ABC transporter ATP-binding protein [Acidobacteriota bacterium]
MDRHRLGRHPQHAAQAGFPCADVRRVDAVHVLRDTRGPRDAVRCAVPGHRPDSRVLPGVPECPGHLCVLRHHLGRRRSHRDRPACQRPPDLPVEAADACRVHRRQGGDTVRVHHDGDLAAGDAPPDYADHVRGELRVPPDEPVPVPGDYRRDAAAGDPGHLHDAGAVVVVEEQPLCRHPVCRDYLLHGRHFRCDDGHYRQHDDFLGVGGREPHPGGGRDLPAAATLRDALVGFPHRHRGAHRRVDLGPGAARPRGGGGDVSAPVVTADHVSKWYGQVIGLNDVSVSVPPGITGLLGPNGAGKSTFMKLITGQLKPSKGTLNVLGEPIWGNPHLYFQIGFCPEQDAFYERMTGLEWVTALVRLNGFSEKEADEAARRAMTAVDLMEAAGKKIGAYSKGMRQRVKLAQAIVHDPALLILDEPLSGMDPLARRRTIRLIRDWARAGKSIIVSSHILHEIESMTANILLINNGRIIAEGDVHHIRDLIDEHPHSVYVRAQNPRALARDFLDRADVRSMRFEEGAVVVETGTPDAFYARLTELAATGEYGAIEEVTSPDDNLQAVFQYLVK